MSNVVDLATIRAHKAEEAKKVELRNLIENLDAGLIRPGPEDRFFELRLRDALWNHLRLSERLDPRHIGKSVSTITFTIEVEDDIPLNTDVFDVFVHQVSDNLPPKIGYLHSTMLAKQGREWSVMVRYFP